VAARASSLVRAASLTHFAEVARQCGLNPDRLLLDAGLDPGVLREPDLMVSAERVQDVLETAAERARDPAFGLRMAVTRQLSNLGPVGLLVRDQPTARESIQVLVRHHATLNGALAMGLEEQGELVLVREELLPARAAQPTRQAIELAVGVLFALLRRLLGPGWRPQRVCFVHAAPRDPGAHQQILGAPVDFGAEFNGIVCLARELNGRNPDADPQMARYAQRLFEAGPGGLDGSIVDQVRRMIALLLPSGRCSIEQVAGHLGLVPRTVQRRLAEQGHSFSELVNDLRVELAQRHVAAGERPLTDVAALLGFAALSGFSRWYQQQFNCSPSQQRASQAARLHGTRPS
jgi:AraC-like DNA-binding protein